MTSDKKKLPKADPHKRKRKPPKKVTNPESSWRDRRVYSDDHLPTSVPLPTPVIDDLHEKQAQATEIVERVFSENGTGELTKADMDFVKLSRIHIAIEAKKRGFDLTEKYLASLETSYNEGQIITGDPKEDAVALGCRKHVTTEIGDLAGIRKKDEDDRGTTFNVIFNRPVIEINNDGTQRNTKQVCTFSPATESPE